MASGGRTYPARFGVPEAHPEETAAGSRTAGAPGWQQKSASGRLYPSRFGIEEGDAEQAGTSNEQVPSRPPVGRSNASGNASLQPAGNHTGPADFYRDTSAASSAAARSTDLAYAYDYFDSLPAAPEDLLVADDAAFQLSGVPLTFAAANGLNGSGPPEFTGFAESPSLDAFLRSISSASAAAASQTPPLTQQGLKGDPKGLNDRAHLLLNASPTAFPESRGLAPSALLSGAPFGGAPDALPPLPLTSVPAASPQQFPKSAAADGGGAAEKPALGGAETGQLVETMAADFGDPSMDGALRSLPQAPQGSSRPGPTSLTLEEFLRSLSSSSLNPATVFPGSLDTPMLDNAGWTEGDLAGSRYLQQMDPSLTRLMGVGLDAPEGATQLQAPPSAGPGVSHPAFQLQQQQQWHASGVPAAGKAFDLAPQAPLEQHEGEVQRNPAELSPALAAFLKSLSADGGSNAGAWGAAAAGPPRANAESGEASKSPGSTGCGSNGLVPSGSDDSAPVLPPNELHDELRSRPAQEAWTPEGQARVRQVSIAESVLASQWRVHDAVSPGIQVPGALGGRRLHPGNLELASEPPQPMEGSEQDRGSASAFHGSGMQAQLLVAQGSAAGAAAAELSYVPNLPGQATEGMHSLGAAAAGATRSTNSLGAQGATQGVGAGPHKRVQGEGDSEGGGGAQSRAGSAEGHKRPAEPMTTSSNSSETSLGKSEASEQERFGIVIPPEVRGTTASHWVLMGQHLEAQGVTLALEKLALSSPRPSGSGTGSPAASTASPPASSAPSSSAPSGGSSNEWKPEQGQAVKVDEALHGGAGEPDRLRKQQRRRGEGSAASEEEANSLSLVVRGPHADGPLSPGLHNETLRLSQGFMWPSAGALPEFARSQGPIPMAGIVPSPWDASTRAAPGSSLVPMALPAPGSSVVAKNAKVAEVKDTLLRAAYALETGQQEKFEEACAQLRPNTKRRGKALERTAYVILEALVQRSKGTGFQFANKPTRLPSAEFNACRMRYFTEAPVHPFSNIALSGMMLPALLGRENVHLVLMGEGVIPYLPNLIKLLAHHKAPQSSSGSSSAGSPSGSEDSSVPGAPQGCLKRFRVTNVASWHLVRPKRLDFETMKESGRVANLLQGVAAQEGVEFEYKGIRLLEGASTSQNMKLLGEVQHPPGEVLIFCGWADLMFLPDEPGPEGGRPELLVQFLQHIKPDLIACTLEDIAGNTLALVPRVSAYFDYMLGILGLHDSLSRPETSIKKNILHVEQSFFYLNVYSSLACTGAEWRLHPRSSHEWSKIFQAAGFQPCPLERKILDAEHEMLSSYPEGLGLAHDSATVALLWEGTPLIFAGAWRPA